jgi:hypothetical protein
MYDTQVPQYQEQIKFLQGLLANVSPPTAAAATTVGFAKATIAPEEREDYGDAFLDVVGRQAQIAVSGDIDQLTTRLKALEQVAGQLYSGQANIHQASFEDKLAGFVPNWRELDTNPGFLNWLDEPDQFSGQPKLALLQAAVRDGDANRAALFFKSWAGDAPTTARASSLTSGFGTISTPSIAHQPDSAAAYASRGAGRAYTANDVQKFYADVRRGVYRGKEAEVAAFERDLEAAMKEGRLMG